MRAKYFTANTKEAAESAACDYFGCAIGELRFDVVSGPDTDSTGDGNAAAPVQPWVIAALHGTSYELDNMNAFPSLSYEADGVYLEIFGNTGKGGSIDSGAVILYIKRKNVQNFNLPVVQALAEAGKGRIKIAPPQQEYIYGEDFTVDISNDEREVTVRLLEPEPGGPMMTLDEARRKLAGCGVTHGIDNELLEKWLSSKVYNEPYVVARATPPEDGEDGLLIFHFSTDDRTGKPREIDVSGRVDYNSLDLYIPVKEGDLLVTRTSATEGKPGITVRGNIIKQKPGREAVMPRGKNIEINGERTEIKSSVSGMVEFVNGAINVSNVYSIQGDCDVSTGNIDFDGSVQISGSVRNGRTIKATNGIFIGGSIEAATLIAGGNVEVKGGMMGADKGLIDAGGSISITFVERGRLLANGPINVDVSVHSILETGSTIQAIGKRGAIIGGHAAAAGDIVTCFVGAISNTKTEIVVGFLPRKRARLNELEKEIANLKADQTKLAQLDAYLEKTKDTMDKATWDKLYMSGVENKRLNNETIKAIEADIMQLQKEMENATDSRIHVFECAYAGTRITIGACSYIVNDDIKAPSFRHGNGEISYGPCEKNKADYKM